MVVVCHQAPGVCRPAIDFLDLTQCLDELDRLEIIIEYELTARNTAIDVIGGSGEKQTGFSRHGMSPMRGRDNFILPSSSHNSTIRYVEVL